MKEKTTLLCFVGLITGTSLWGQTPIDSVQHLHEVVVIGNEAERNLNAPELGRVTLTDKMILDMPVMFGEPDLVKSLQTQPGVSQGVEGFTGLYVRGGENDENLFLYQGLPLYQISHLGGIFSSFNVATVGKADFYKSSFPARYGGRISSITDIGMKEPSFKKITGRLSLGLLSGSLFVSGPIVKNKTAFAVGLRRTWLDVLTSPALAIYNSSRKKKGEKLMGNYNFTDFNARIDHRFNANTSAYLVGYYGRDRLKLGERSFESKEDNEKPFFDEDLNRLSWGNWGVLAALNYKPQVGMFNVSAYYTDYSSTYRQGHTYQTDMSDNSTYGYSHSRTDNVIRDAAVTASYAADFFKWYSLETGAGYIHHDYLPSKLWNDALDQGQYSSSLTDGRYVSANETFAYVSNTFNPTPWLALNAGVRAVDYIVTGRNSFTLEPRAAMRLKISGGLSFKMGYSRMYQHVQQVSTVYINLPTDSWQPVTSKFNPLRSDQVSAGFFGNLPWNMYFSVEGWYKDMKNLLEYREGISSLNPDLSWDDKLTSGRGWAYGADVSLKKTEGPVTGSIGYSLMWNWRKFAMLNQGRRYPAKFDNRHKIDIGLKYKLSPRVEFNANWMYMTGNRLTLSLYNYDIPSVVFPNGPFIIDPNESDVTDGLDYYSSRNNIRLPAYHHLDIGLNWYKPLKHGRMGMWNFSIYNVYCHMNAITISKKDKFEWDNGAQNGVMRRSFKTLSILPIMPSVSYTYMF